MDVPDHLQHQQLVEIGVEQAAHNRIEPEIVVIRALGNIGDGHAAILLRVGLDEV
jgi:hypothetical protein